MRPGTVDSGGDGGEAECDAGKLMLHGFTALRSRAAASSAFLAYQATGPLFLFGAVSLLLALAAVMARKGTWNSSLATRTTPDRLGL